MVPTGRIAAGAAAAGGGVRTGGAVWAAGVTGAAQARAAMSAAIRMGGAYTFGAMLLSWAQWVGDLPTSIALRESLYVWPLLESAHVLTLMLFAGTAAMLDLRLLGVTFKGVPASEFTDRLLPWTRAAFAVMTLTGALLVYANPVRYYFNLFFRLKLLLLVLAGLNIWWFHSRTHRGISAWDVAARPPRAARVAAIVSLAAWTGVIVTGRMVAYNWFDCDLQPHSAFVNWAAGCIVPPVEPPQ